MENGKQRKVIKSFRDLEVYERLYENMLVVLRDVVPKLPMEERYDLNDQLRRCCKAGPALVAEGFAKRYQLRNWKKYLEDAMGECNEMLHHLSVCVDVYGRHLDVKQCQDLIDSYNIANKQLYRLRESWKDFHQKY